MSTFTFYFFVINDKFVLNDVGSLWTRVQRHNRGVLCLIASIEEMKIMYEK